MKITTQQLQLLFDEKTLHFSVAAKEVLWSWQEGYHPYLLLKNGEVIRFDEASVKEHKMIENGVGSGILSHYEGFEKSADLALETYVWLEETTGDFWFEWIPLSDGEEQIAKVFWPGAMEFRQASDGWYTLIPEEQGLLVPNTWPQELKALVFDGMFLTAGAYMPWFGQVRDKNGYIAIAQTPWNGGIWVDHPMEGGYTHTGAWWEPSLGKMDYRRVLRFSFFEKCDYNDLCKEYREYVKETGHLVTLREKEIRNPGVKHLIGAEFVHFGIKSSTNPASEFYNHEHPEKNGHLTSFADREKMIRRLHEQGAGKMYLHLDGWAEPGYDNRHPDYFPACEEAGGWDGMRSLAEAMHEVGGYFGIHDQYRDYYHDAPSYEEEYAVQSVDGSHYTHAKWAGGPQSYLCASQALYYVKRNFNRLFENYIPLDGAYLDVFTCNEGDECANPRHRMSRRECYEYRKRCFDYLTANGILPSSEEVSDWSMDSLVFCHYAPYDFMLRQPGAPKKGIPVPLFNLVYHDCVVEPWMMEKHETEDYMLYALLNGGAPYLVRLGAYDGTDGAYDGAALAMEEHMKRCQTVASLHEKVAYCELKAHRILDGDPKKQESIFADGTRVRVNFHDGTYEVRCGYTE